VHERLNSNGVVHWEVYLGRRDGVPVRRYFKRKSIAEDFAQRMRNQKRLQGIDAIRLPTKLRLEAMECVERLSKVGCSLTEATNFFLARAKPANAARTLADASAELLQAKIRSNRKETTVKALGWSLGTFNRSFGHIQLHEFTADQMEDWLQESDYKPRTKNGYLRDVGGLFRFGIKKGYCAENPLKDIEKITTDDVEPEIFSVVEAQSIMRMCELHPELQLTPCFAIQFFAGLRTSELLDLDWSDVKIGRFVTVRGPTAKSRRIRNVRMMENLESWLRRSLCARGPVAPVNYWDRRRDLKVLLGLEYWKQNGCRHSFGSYLYALEEDATYVAAQMGHTGDKMLFEHYRALVDPEDAMAYWAIMPLAKESEAAATGKLIGAISSNPAGVRRLTS